MSHPYTLKFFSMNYKGCLIVASANGYTALKEEKKTVEEAKAVIDNALSRPWKF